MAGNLGFTNVNCGLPGVELIVDRPVHPFNEIVTFRAVPDPEQQNLVNYYHYELGQYAGQGETTEKSSTQYRYTKSGK